MCPWCNIMVDDGVYASILDRVERSEKRELLQKVVRKEYRSIKRRMRQASESMLALQQLQAASEHLRPTGDWLPTTLLAQVECIEEFDRNLETAIMKLEKVVGFEMGKKRERPLDEKEKANFKQMERKEAVGEGGRSINKKEKSEIELKSAKKDERIGLNQEKMESGVEFLEVVTSAEKQEVITIRGGSGGASQSDEERKRDNGKSISKRETGERRAEIRIEQHEDEELGGETLIVKETRDTIVEAEGNALKSQVGDDLMSGRDELPCGMVRVTCDAALRMKEEPMTSPDEHTRKAKNSQSDAWCEPTLQNIVELPIELEVYESSDSEELR